jgi:dihydrofolate reductase
MVAADDNWGIGKGGELLVRIPNDLRHFREETRGKIIIYGRKTLPTFPQGLPLPERRNLLLSTKPDYQVRGAEVVPSLSALSKLLSAQNPADIFIIGGESIYRQLLPYCRTAHVTKIDRRYDATHFFPNLDIDPAWKLTAESDEQTYFDIPYTFMRYERIADFLDFPPQKLNNERN